MSRPVSIITMVVLSAASVAVWPDRLAVAADPVALRGLQFLKSHASQAPTGEMALMALAMVKAEVPVSDPTLSACLAGIGKRFSGSVYTPARQGGADVYEAGVVSLALVNLDPVGNQSRIQAVANYLIGRQKANGSWDYDFRTAGDTSISQYAVLGLWEAENAGIRIPPQVWDRAAAWYLSVQSPAGSWNYHRDEGAQWPETLSMTAAGVGSLLICKRQLEPYRKQPDDVTPLLTPLELGSDPAAKYKPRIAASTIDAAARRGIAWLTRNFAPANPTVAGPSSYYGLYGVERVGSLAGRDLLGGLDWYEQGRRYILANQQADGSWADDYGSEVNTAYALLFLTKATAQSIRKFESRRLGAGTLLGGRGLPEDLSSLTVAQGRVVVRPMNGAVEGMLGVLEDSRSDDADSALAGLVDRYRAEGPGVLRPHKDRLRKMLTDPDPGVRRVAAWALGRLGDLDVVPTLAEALGRPEEDDAVVAEARTSLQFLSRKIEGYGPPDTSTPDQRAAAAKDWLAWYREVLPIGKGPASEFDAEPFRRPSAGGQR